MANSLIKLIEYSLVPAVLMILGKLFGVYITAALFSVDVVIKTGTGNFFDFSPVVGVADLQLVASYSDLIMFIFVAIGFSINLVMAVYTHDTHINTKTINLLAKFNLLSLISSSFQLYHSGIIWFLFTWLSIIVILINILIGNTQIWVLIISGFFATGLSVVLFKDLIKEVELTKQKLLKGQI